MKRDKIEIQQPLLAKWVDARNRRHRRINDIIPKSIQQLL